MKGLMVSLVPFEEDDVELIYKWRQSDLTSTLMSGSLDFVSLNEMKEQMRQDKTRYVGVKTNAGRKIGFVSWHEVKTQGNYQIGGTIGDPSIWDEGYGVEATKLIMDYLFHFKNAHRLQFITGLYNTRTISMLMKHSTQIEGILRDYYFLDGKYHDAVICSVLRDEYYEYYEENPEFYYNIFDPKKLEETKEKFRRYYENQRSLFSNLGV
ncbi:GNAT family N-acetyltransferase [Lysinibacillus sp. Ag94]|uniref:GNAT family N-acetyltransferase n=1 Tax=Lysinibacillus sp. Ag94 TaxID=2936682 RepID=UPI00200E2A80|nr:GNAT family protein [Lysinibacillus sp. Ag94]UPW84173.1 GNAT family N-acetyltransferase [Lysinibacillus sp. Ag94]